ncbi:Serine/threonine protein kinase [Trichostrongylus colubriformis]|uniref:Serine/threonine protein kinase n=1 Tax=Trichostrongylus colubriformis TaxID=6319 RepID=A0AAN8FWD0_TRICO
MLPEYADEMSRSDFLREIGLMKTLGYHERLVNMLACITETEPLCLVVEYCSDGDLLRFLRERCKYMMKLDAAGVNYHEPPIDDSYDIEMVITLKQLLMFAVQVSYGLEYLSSKGFVHRDVAARNVLVHGKNACKIGDFGLCRNLYADNSLYKSKGGRLPLKWMSPEAIRHYEFSAQSDVWAFGVLLFEIITLGGSPYPSVSPEEMLPFLENGGRMERPDNCPENFYDVMCQCWTVNPRLRPDFSVIRQKLASLLEEITEEYSYLTLDAQKDYYNVQYGDQKPDVIVIPESETISIGEPKEKTLDTSMLSIDSLPIDDVTTWSDDNSAKELKTNDSTVRRKTPSGDTGDSMMGADNSAFKGDSL